MTLAGDFDTVALKTAPQDALHGPIEGKARVYRAASMLIWAAFGIPPPGGRGRGLHFHHLQAARAQITTYPFLPPFRPTLWGIVWGIDFKAKRKGPLGGLNLLILFGGRWATRTPGLWFRRPTLYPPELIARAKKFYQMHPPCQGNPERRLKPAPTRTCRYF